MLFNSFTFLIFFLVVFALFHVIRAWSGKKRMLLAASYVFYAAWSPPYVLLLLLSTVVDWWLARKIAGARSESRRRFLLVLSLVCNLGLLAYFKYANFFLENFSSLLSAIGVPFQPVASGIVLPLAISFYTFASLSYTIDAYRREIATDAPFVDYALFVGFFPHLIAGPIVRAAYLLPQIAKPRQPSYDDIAWGSFLIVIGLFAKVVLADAVLAPVVNQVFGAAVKFGAIDTWAAVFSFSGQIYFDFCGYSLCAIGIARCFGFSFPDNFHFPYAAAGFSDFWRRWHISLSTWLRDYLYIPLGGNRGKWLAYRNLMLTMLLGGLWHGASWMFVLWGALHGLYLVVERFIRHSGSADPRPAAPLRSPTTGLMLFTFLIVSLTWIPFRARTTAEAESVLSGLLRLSSPNVIAVADIALAISVVVLTVGVNIYMRMRSLKDLYDSISSRFHTATLLICLVTLFLVSGGDQRAFIYFQF
jgi:D-alanyl-lipoteichoic acid acyltransferase DltB (MBOAT superfamily)